MNELFAGLIIIGGITLAVFGVDLLFGILRGLDEL